MNLFLQNQLGSRERSGCVRAEWLVARRFLVSLFLLLCVIGSPRFAVEPPTGKNAGIELATRNVAGDRPENIPAVNDSRTRVEVDGRPLRRSSNPESALLPGRGILFREPAFWKTHEELVIAVIIALLVQSILIVLLLVQRRTVARARTELERQGEELQRLSGYLIKAQEEERARIARELHDNVNQRLALLSMRIRQSRPLAAVGDIGSRLEELSLETSDISNDVHELAHGLYPSKLDHLGLMPAVKRLCKNFEKHHGISVELIARNTPPKVGRDTTLCLFRVIQESLQNVSRHSGADRATVAVQNVNGDIRVMVADNGRGFDVRRAARGLGLVGMRERLRPVDGRITINSAHGVGTKVVVSVPNKTESP